MTAAEASPQGARSKCSAPTGTRKCTPCGWKFSSRDVTRSPSHCAWYCVPDRVTTARTHRLTSLVVSARMDSMVALPLLPDRFGPFGFWPARLRDRVEDRVRPFEQAECLRASQFDFRDQLPLAHLDRCRHQQ